MDLKIIENLIKMVNASALESLEVEQDGFKIKLVNNTKNKAPILTENIISTTKSQDTLDSPADQTTPEAADDTDYKYITSPIVGIFHTLASVKKGCIDVGSKVNTGDVVCVVEAMKLINEIESNVEGEIVEVMVNDGDQVEYGQKLFKLK